MLFQGAGEKQHILVIISALSSPFIFIYNNLESHCYYTIGLC